MGGFDDDRQSRLGGEGFDLGRVLQGTVDARCQGSADLLRELTGGDLVAEGRDRVRRRADPDETRGLDGGSEVGVLGQESVSGVDGIGAGGLRSGENRVDVEVGLTC